MSTREHPSNDPLEAVPTMPHSDVGNLNPDAVVRDFSDAIGLRSMAARLHDDLEESQRVRASLMAAIDELDRLADIRVERMSSHDQSGDWAEGVRHGISFARVTLQRRYRDLTRPESIRAIRRLADESGVTVRIDDE